MREEGIFVDVKNIGAFRSSEVAHLASEAMLPHHQYECVVMLGDRWELLFACAEALKSGLPIIHLHGGEHTAGSFDDLTRDAVSKIASVHFVSHRAYACHLEHIGETQEIHVVGAPGLDNFVNVMCRPPKNELMELNMCVATWHPVTLADESVQPLIDALRETGMKVMWTIPNRDPGRDEIIEAVGNSNFSFPTPATFINYCMKSMFVIGNSSMGLIEAPTLGIPSINIGTRQNGRIRSKSVIDCGNTVDKIKSAIHEAKTREPAPSFEFGVPGMVSPIIARIIKQMKPGYLKAKKCESL
jgi:UDP-N-acetylglucosamine 2-epimerase (non-hydrolysing)/GDP/UDP-N,N'-diacetylbacillosamine 2-epimerase (hydrolysing)